MSLLSDLKTILAAEPVALPAEVGVYKGTPAPSQYAVLVPLSDTFECADDEPAAEIQAVRISLYSNQSYTSKAMQIVKAVIAAGLTITDRHYIGHEDATGYHHYVIDVESNYIWEE